MAKPKLKLVEFPLIGIAFANGGMETEVLLLVAIHDDGMIEDMEIELTDDVYDILDQID